ncbi:Transmembrane exosortase [Pseudodesulfovibrio hydrargyri]|uniref:Transmembrane exosortase n=1 Tax=Pseudodesulfovibrio hydrargyri TaxID=2125990 RepID=A0A1J5N2V7_9BACT|nr:exosortase A [Pseudodesulfovibrio hydrargyri]OIQ49144.1 Transmembrane exosortase [Pseudodesulfovibrio hydrargyri]
MTVSKWLEANKWYVAAYCVVIGLVYHEIITDMVSDWARDDNYSHGFLVPLVSAYFLWANRKSILEAPAEPAGWGLWIVLLGLAQLVVGSLATEYFTMRTSMITVTGGTIVYLLGWEACRRMLLPLLYLLLMVPIPVILYDSMTMPLKLFVAKVSVQGLVFFGYPVLREGNIIMLPNITLEVADACSGLRSLMSLIALSVAFAFLTQRGVWKKWVLIVSALPVAVITNIMRVFLTGVLAKHYGSVAAEGFFHEFAGFMVFFVAMVVMAVIGWGLKLGEKRHES